MTTNSPISSSSFDEGLENFRLKSGLTYQELFDMEMTTLPDLQRALASMQKTQQGSKKMMHLKRLQPFLDAMEQYGEILNIFVNTSKILAFIWGPIKFLLLTTSNTSEAFNALLEGYLSIGEQIPLLLQYRQLFEANQYMRTALATIFEDIMDFHLEAVRLFKQKTWKQLYHATGQSLKNRIKQFAESMQRHKAILEAQASLVEYQQFEVTSAYMKAEFAKLQSSENDRRCSRVQEWLGCAVNNRTRHENVNKQRFGNSGQWLLQDQCFKNWFASNQCVDPLLWLHGLPGSGKTVLASLVVEEVAKIAGIVSLCFYCKQADQEKNGFLTVAKSLISQILSNNKSILDYLYEKASKSGEATLSTIVLAKEILEVALKSSTKVYIVLDGLDEYSRDDRKGLASWFQQLITGLPKTDFGSIRCLFTSQEDGFARKDLSMLSQIKITPAANKADIESFCKHWHNKIEAKFGPLEKAEHHVTQIITARAQGMFLFAKLVTWNLYQQVSRADFEAEMQLGRVPEQLDQAYDRIIERLVSPSAPQSRRIHIRRLLGWLACAKRPLRWYEIQGAVSIDMENGIVSPKQQFREDCKDLCASLVEIDSDQEVTLVHSTTKIYLIRNNFFQVQEIELDMASTCIVYLSMPAFEVSKSIQDLQEAFLQGTYSFVDYAVCFWAIHLESAISSIAKKCLDRLSEVLECLEAFLGLHWAFEGKPETISNTVRHDLDILKQHPSYNQICQAVTFAKNQLRPTGKGPSDDDRLQLSHVLSEIRVVLENMTSLPSMSKDEETFIRQNYGLNHYKCNRMNCQFFYRGFVTSTQRDQHIAKHNRSFTCGSQGCPYEIIGFINKKELQKHELDQHGMMAECDRLEFPESETSELKQSQKGTFQCDLCKKLFTRKDNLRSHMRTHNEVPQFDCTVCGKAFLRQHDRKRHEKLHSEKQFVCTGELSSPPGARWGCGRRFASADVLGLHFQSQAGRICIKPLIDEEVMERQRDMIQQQQKSLDPALPSSLLAQYPELQKFKWSQTTMPQDSEDPSTSTEVYT